MSQSVPKSPLRRPRYDSELKGKAMRRAAKKLFLREGFSNTSMEAIAREANVSKRTVYTHFSNKEALFAEVIQEMCEQVLPADTIALDAHEDDVAATLEQLGVIFLGEILSREQVQLYRTVVSDSRLYPAIGKVMYNGPIMASQRLLSAFFERLVAKGALELEDCAMAATLFIAMLKADVQMRLLFNVAVPRKSREIETMSRATVKLFLNGALPR